MKFKVGEIRPVIQGLEEIIKIDLPVKPSYWLARILVKIGQEARSFDNVRVKLIEKYGARDDKGKLILDKKTNNYEITDKESFNKEFKELAEQEFEIDVKPIKLDDLGDINIKPYILARLQKIIVE